MAKGCFQKIPDCYRRQPVLRLPGLESNQVLVSHLNLGGVLDQQNSFVLRDEFSDDVQQSRLAAPGSARNKDVLVRQHIILQPVGKPSFESPGLHEVVDAEMPRVELSNCQSDAVQTAWRNDGGDAAPIRQSRVENGL